MPTTVLCTRRTPTSLDFQTLHMRHYMALQMVTKNQLNMYQTSQFGKRRDSLFFANELVTVFSGHACKALHLRRLFMSSYPMELT